MPDVLLLGHGLFGLERLPLPATVVQLEAIHHKLGFAGCLQHQRSIKLQALDIDVGSLNDQCRVLADADAWPMNLGLHMTWALMQLFPAVFLQLQHDADEHGHALCLQRYISLTIEAFQGIGEHSMIGMRSLLIVFPGLRVAPTQSSSSYMSR